MWLNVLVFLLQWLIMKVLLAVVDGSEIKYFMFSSLKKWDCGLLYNQVSNDWLSCIVSVCFYMFNMVINYFISCVVNKQMYHRDN